MEGKYIPCKHDPNKSKVSGFWVDKNSTYACLEKLSAMTTLSIPKNVNRILSYAVKYPELLNEFGVIGKDQLDEYKNYLESLSHE